jgi:hypothetical protein
MSLKEWISTLYFYILIYCVDKLFDFSITFPRFFCQLLNNNTYNVHSIERERKSIKFNLIIIIVIHFEIEICLKIIEFFFHKYICNRNYRDERWMSKKKVKYCILWHEKDRKINFNLNLRLNCINANVHDVRIRWMLDGIREIGSQCKRNDMKSP